MRLAIIADIHSNWPALQAVLDDIDQQNVDHIILAGDAINGGPLPGPVLDAIYQHDIAMVIGNHEEYVLETRQPETEWEVPPEWGTSHWTAARLRPADWDFLTALPRTLTLEDGPQEVLVVHAAPQDTTAGVYPQTSASELATRFGSVSAPVIVTAHTHLPLVTHWRDKRIINPGSVGMSLDGSPLAAYAILTWTAGRFIVQPRRVAYDQEALHNAMHETGFLADATPWSDAFLKQMTTGQNFTFSLVARIRQLEAEQGLSLPDAIRAVDVARLQPHQGYNAARP